MPVVPEYRNFTVAPTANAPQFAEPQNAEQVTGHQLQQAGGALTEAGGAARDVALDMQRTVDQVKVNDALNQARGVVNNLTYDPQVGYLAAKGNAALTRDSGMALPDEYGGKLQSALQGISSTALQTDQQRRLFQEHASNLQTSFTGDVERHMLGEFKTYRVSTNDGTIDLAQDDAKRNWNDPVKVTSALDAAKAAVYDKGQTLGWSPSQVDAAVLKTTSNVHLSAVMAALENNNPTYALGYLDKFKSQMSADDILRVQGHVNNAAWLQMSMGAVQGAAQDFAPKMQPSPAPFDRMVAITSKTESNDNPNAVGPYVPGQGSAKGLMQVMDATAASPGFGIKPAMTQGPPEAIVADRARVGREYLQALMQKYGDPAKAWAAYNWGPGNLDGALKQAGGTTDWQTLLPAETKAYVTKNMAALGGAPGSTPTWGQGAVQRPTEGDFVNAALGRLPPGAAPQVVKMTREAAVTQFGVINKTLAEQGENALRAGQNWIATNPGIPIDQMPPALRDPINQYTPDKWVEMEHLSKALQRGDTVTDLALYNRMAAHPEELGRLSDSQFEMLRSKLAPADFKHFANERSNWINGKTDDSAGGINSKAVNTTLNEKLAQLQIDSAPKPTDLAGRERVGAIQQFVRNSIFDAQRQAGKKFTPGEIDDHINGLFAKDASFRTYMFGSVPLPFTSESQPIMSMQVGDIPSDQSDAIKAALAKLGKTNPSNTDILNTYRRWKLGQR